MSVRRRASGRAHYNYYRDYDPALARYVESDPIGLFGGINPRSYAFSKPVSHFDPIGLDVWVVINNNAPVTGSHAGFYMDLPMPLVYDPRGSYRPSTRGHDVVEGEGVSLKDYVESEIRDSGPEVEVFHFRTSDEEDAQIVSNIGNYSCPIGGLCAVCTSDVLNGVGPFRELGKRWFPSTLASRLRKIQQSAPDPNGGGGGGGGW